MSVTKFKTITLNDTNDILIDGNSLSTRIYVKLDWDHNSIVRITAKIEDGDKVGYVFKSGNVCTNIIEEELCFHVLELYAVREQPVDKEYEVIIDLRDNPLCIKDPGSLIFTKYLILTKQEFENLVRFKCKSYSVSAAGTGSLITTQPETKDGAIIVSI